MYQSSNKQPSSIIGRKATINVFLYVLINLGFHHTALYWLFIKVLYGPYKAVWRTLKLILIACKKYLLLEINTLTKFLLSRMKFIIDGGRLFDVYLTHIITLLSQSENEVIHLFGT